MLFIGFNFGDIDFVVSDKKEQENHEIFKMRKLQTEKMKNI
jgi:hypothetical protein